MKRRTGLIIGGILGAGALAGVIYLLKTRPKPILPPEAYQATVRLEIVGARTASPELVLEEGKSYTLKVSVTNNSTKGGVPWEATLETTLYASLDTTYLISPTSTGKVRYSAGEKKTFTYPFTVPVGTAGRSGAAVAGVYDPDGKHIATGYVMYSVKAVPVTYAAIVEVTI